MHYYWLLPIILITYNLRDITIIIHSITDTICIYSTIFTWYRYMRLTLIQITLILLNMVEVTLSHPALNHTGAFGVSLYIIVLLLIILLTYNPRDITTIVHSITYITYINNTILIWYRDITNINTENTNTIEHVQVTLYDPTLLHIRVVWY